jgi:hypothetical protein
VRVQLSNPQLIRSAAILGAGLAFITASLGAPQEGLRQTLEEKVSRAGVFFRADAPRVLRNQDDPDLPLYLEIINGVEKTGHSTARRLVQFLNRDPLKLEGVKVYIKPSGANRVFADDPIQLGSSKEFSFDARVENQPFTIPDRMKKTLEIPLSLIQAYLDHHYVGGPFDSIDLKASFDVTAWPAQDFCLRVRLKAPPLPQLSNWYRGDIHYHSTFTDNPAERGNPLGVSKQVALDAGLNWVVLTDHSTDLGEDEFAKELKEAKGYSDGRFMFIRGEEVTVASASPSNFTTLHLLALPSPDNPDKGFPDAAAKPGSVILTGDGSPGSAAMPLKDALARVAAAGGVAYAAHPFDPISPILRGGSWDVALDFLASGGQGLQAGLVGLESWNRAATHTANEARDPFCLHQDADPSACFRPDKDANQYTRLEKGIEMGWRPLLIDGLKPSEKSGDSPRFKVFMAAGSDAHGDFDFEATLDALDFLSKPMRGVSGYAEDNAFGKLSTVVYCPAGMGPRGENILQALRDGRSVLSNGPLLVAGFDVNGNGSIGDPEDVTIGQQYASAAKEFLPLQVEWASSDEFGPLQSLRLIIGSKTGESDPIEVQIPPRKALASDGLYPIDLISHLGKLGPEWGYVRLAARTVSSAGEEFRCYTNPIWIRLGEH